MTNYLTQDAPLSPPDTSRAEEEEARFEKNLELWKAGFTDNDWLNHCDIFVCEHHHEEFMKYLTSVYRSVYDKLHKEIEDDRYPL